jgi:hypothetical protein
MGYMTIDQRMAADKIVNDYADKLREHLKTLPAGRLVYGTGLRRKLGIPKRSTRFRYAVKKMADEGLIEFHSRTQRKILWVVVG